jgi:hypothetical protein
MRRFLTGLVVAAAAVVPALAIAGNQEVAEQIANRLRTSGQMSDYKVGVKYQDGTAWLHGHVSSQEQMNTAMRLVFKTASVDRVVNQLVVTPSDAAQPAETELAQDNASHNDSGDDQTTQSGSNPLRDQDAAPVAETQQPTKVSFMKRLETAFQRKPKQDASRSQPARETDAGYASQVPTSYTPTNVEQVAAEEPQELPRSLTPTRQARPVARTAREPINMAMTQQAPRGPVVPNGAPLPMYRAATAQAGTAPARYDQPCMPNYAWPSYAAYPNYAAVTYPKQYSPTAWPYIGPFYPYPQVPMGWRKVTLEWDSGWWFLDFKDQPASCWQR